jgi:hypothetical protein
LRKELIKYWKVRKEEDAMKRRLKEEYMEHEIIRKIKKEKTKEAK